MNPRHAMPIAALIAALSMYSARTGDAPSAFLAAVSSPALGADAIRAFHDLGLRDKIPAIRKSLDDRDENARIAAIVALSQWGDDESRAAFQSAALSDVTRVRLAGREALYRLDSLERYVPYPHQTLANLALALKHERSTVRHEAAAVLVRYGAKAKVCLNELNGALSMLDGSCRTEQIESYLDVLRQTGADAETSGSVICGLLDERAGVYSGRDMHDAYRLRARFMLALADINQAQMGIRVILDMLANSDQASMLDFAAAAYAAGTLGPRGAELVPFLARALNADFKDAPVSFRTNSAMQILSPENATSGRLEAIRALSKIGPSAAAVVPLLNELLKTDPNPADNLPAWKADAKKALAAITKTGAQ